MIKGLKRLLCTVACLSVLAPAMPVLAVEATPQAQETPVFDFDGTQAEAGEYTLPVQLCQYAKPDTLSLGNESLEPEGHIVIDNEGRVTAAVSFKPMEKFGMKGYLGWMDIITKIVETATTGYPTKVEVENTKVTEAYQEVMDEYNNPESEKADGKLTGKWYPKTVSFPTTFNQIDTPVQIYVPVMEAMSAGSGTQLAYLRMDWSKLTKVTPPSPTPEVKPETKPEIAPVEDGLYKVAASLVRADRSGPSMANAAISPWVKVKVEGGQATLTVDISGLMVSGSRGYLNQLSYYAQGYTYQGSKIMGDLVGATPVSFHVKDDGTPVVDAYNDADHPYPKEIAFPLVDTARDDAEGYVPLRVVVPLMESLAAGTGTHDVLLKLDWTTLLKTTEDDADLKPETKPVDPAFHQSKSKVTVSAGEGIIPEGTTLEVKPLLGGDALTQAQGLLTGRLKNAQIFDIQLVKDGVAVIPKGPVTVGLPVDHVSQGTPGAYRLANGSAIVTTGKKAGDQYQVTWLKKNADEGFVVRYGVGALATAANKPAPGGIKPSSLTGKPMAAGAGLTSASAAKAGAAPGAAAKAGKPGVTTSPKTMAFTKGLGVGVAGTLLLSGAMLGGLLLLGRKEIRRTQKGNRP